MKQFFKFMFASMVGFILTAIIGVVILSSIVGAIIAFAERPQTATVMPNTVLKIALNHPIMDRTSNNPFENFEWGTFKPIKELGLQDIIKNIQKAKNDDNIKGIYLEFSFASLAEAGIATVEEIRNTLLDFKESGKFILSYSEIYSQKAYYLASVADGIYLFPKGFLEFKGLYTELAFFKGTLEKLEIQPQIIRHGKFKSAVEPFLLDSMSKENEAQIQTFVGSIWNHLLASISTSRNIPYEELNTIANNLLVRNAEDAVTHHLADGLLYNDEVVSKIREKMVLEEGDEINFIELKKYMNVNSPKETKLASQTGTDTLKQETKINRHSKDKIAVIYAQGEINSGKGDYKSIGSEGLSKTIREAREDDNIKAIVLRVNSPGGSALASDVIWREMDLATKAKPVVVSMGNVAASGGYYIACPADTIVAEPNTITGSIGVFGILFNMKNFFNNKLGVTFDRVKTNTYADLGSPTRSLSPAEYKFIQQGVEEIYDDFITKVASGRGLNKASVDSIGQGRVWSGVDAKRIGLVDVLGGLEDAIRIAADMAHLEDYKIMDLPKQKETWEIILNEWKDETETFFVKNRLGENYTLYQQMQTIKNREGYQTLLPYDINIQ